MENLKYTKGKWRQGLEKKRAVLCENEGKILGICVTDIGNRISQEEAKANAKLIASAPELLEDLIEAKSLIKRDGYGDDHLTMEIINNAIKKAT